MQLKAFNFPGAPTISVNQLALKSTLQRVKTSRLLGCVDNKDKKGKERAILRVEWYETEDRYLYLVSEAKTLQYVPFAALSTSQVCNPGTVAREIILHRMELQ